MRDNLSKASFYLLCFEILKTSITDPVKSFFANEYENGIPKESQDYRQKVLNRNRSPAYASLDWLKEMGAISAHDIDAFKKSKDLRNTIAHESQRIITGSIEIHETDFDVILELLNKINTWWIREVEIPTNSEFDGSEINEGDILPGQVIVLNLIRSIAFQMDSK